MLTLSSGVIPINFTRPSEAFKNDKQILPLHGRDILMSRALFQRADKKVSFHIDPLEIRLI